MDIKTRIEKLAKILFDIHGWDYTPLYEMSENNYRERKNINVNKIDMELFKHTEFPTENTLLIGLNMIDKDKFNDDVREWSELPGRVDSSDFVDKYFFKKMALHILKKLSGTLDINQGIEKLAVILCDIHGHCYPPFYTPCDNKNNPPKLRYGWEYIPKRSKDRTKVDKMFFIKMAKYILRDISA